MKYNRVFTVEDTSTDVERLRLEVVMLHQTWRDCIKSIDELYDENVKLREVLESFANIAPYIDSNTGEEVYAFTERMSLNAKNALKNDGMSDEGILKWMGDSDD